MPKVTAQARFVDRQDFIDAAWRLLACGSWRHLTVDDVCAEAGASKAAFYGHFVRKQDLLLAMLEQEAASVEVVLADLRRQQHGAAERLRRFVRASLWRAADPARVQLRVDLWAMSIEEPAVRELLLATVNRERAAVRAVIEEGIRGGELRLVPASGIASVLLALTEGVLLHGGLDLGAFHPANIYRVLDGLLDGSQP